ncbi:hypothetical protein BWI17_21375 [Betaproteobacteria bacterium GR16-43]|nr:hypothetical protein BWI17_21375 [Betaproteobacteria bacterium GR16-43]
MKYITALLVALFTSLGAAAKDHACEKDAMARAKKLLSFHVDMKELEDRMGFEGAFVMPSIKNPAAPQQKFEVLEVVGYISPRGEYRMRFIYYIMKAGDCLLMGQEILEKAKI